MRIYGPVPSRRFGLSLGVDIVPHKTCPLDCIYCQLGPTDCTSIYRDDFYSIEEIIADVRDAIADGPMPDVITLAGSGEPGLYKSLGELIDALKEVCGAPVLLITNAVLLTDKEMASAALKADILAPSLDAGDAETFQRINRPHGDIRFDDVVEALRQTTHAHKGEIRLEVMLIKDQNDSEESIRRIADIVKTLRYDQLDLNTPVRPPVPERGALPCDEDTLALAQRILGDKAVPIAKFTKPAARLTAPHSFSDRDKTVRETLLRRPCTMDDLSSSLGMSREEVRQTIERLLDTGLVFADVQGNDTYYRTTSPNPTIRNLNN